MTRKRMWKDDEGRIVTKRPMINNQGCNVQIGTDSDCRTLSPISGGTSEGHYTTVESTNPTATTNDAWAFFPFDMKLTDGSMQDGDSFWEAPNNANPAVPTDLENVMFEDAFNPDTGMLAALLSSKTAIYILTHYSEVFQYAVHHPGQLRLVIRHQRRFF